MYMDFAPLSLFPKQYNYLHSTYTVLGIKRNPEMIQTRGEYICYMQILPNLFKHLNIPGF